MSPRKTWGTATGASAFFRSMGGAFGTAIFGTVLTSRLTEYLQERIPGGVGSGDTSSLLGSPASILALPAPVRDAVMESFVRALYVVYLSAIPFTIAPSSSRCSPRDPASARDDSKPVEPTEGLAPRYD